MKYLSKKLDKIKKFGLENIVYGNLKFHSKLGEGSTGSVYKCKIKSEFYAVKIFDYENYSDINELIDDIYNELYINNIVKDLNDCNNIEKYSIYNRLDSVKFYLISKYYDNSMDLRKFLTINYKNNEWKISQNIRIYIIKLIIEAVYQLHNVNVIHCDIKLENIIIYKNEKKEYEIKIIDYGVCCNLKREKYYDASDYDYHFGTVGYMPKEVYYNKKLSYSSDIYSLMICIIELLVGNIWSNIKIETFKSCLIDIKKSLKKINNKDLYNYINNCLLVKYNNRPTMFDITTTFNRHLLQLVSN